MRALSLALTGAVLCACASQGMAAAGDRRPAAAEAVYAVHAAKSGLTVNVSSNGCTKDGDFRAQVRREAGVAVVTLVRVNPDRCQSFVQGRTDLTFDYDSIGLGRREPFRLANPLTVWTGPGD